MEKSRKLARAAQMCALVAGCALAPSASALYVGMYAIGDFVPGSSGGCGGGDRGSWPGMAQAWWDHMLVHGHYGGAATNRYRYINGAWRFREVCDTRFNGSCRDHASAAPSGIDWMDAAIIATHGADSGDHWQGTMRMPDLGNCAIDGGGSSTEMAVGDSYLEFLHVSSCFSADDDNLSGIRNAMEDTGTLRAHQWDGFHGLMWISSSFNGDYSDVAHDGHYVSVAYSWVTNLYRPNQFDCAWYDPFNVFGTCQDQCPVAYTIGNSQADALNRLNERYNSFGADPSDNTAWAWMAYGGCDPSGETTWNP